MAPSARASSIGIVRPGDRLAPVRTRWLTVSSIGAEPLAADRLGVGEIEPEAVGLDLAAGLLRMLAQVQVQGVVQDVGRRVGAADRLPPLGVDLGLRLGVEA